MNKKIIYILLGFLLLLAAIIGSIVAYYQQTHQYLTLNFTPIENSTITLQKEGEPAGIVAPGERNYLPKGDYIVAVTGENIQKQTMYIELQEGEMELSVPVTLSKETLTGIYKEEEANITYDVLEQYPSTANLYDVHASVQKDGTWAAITLTAKNKGSNSDTLSLIAKKESDSWQMMTKPAITLSKAEYPDIPQEVLDSLIPQ